MAPHVFLLAGWEGANGGVVGSQVQGSGTVGGGVAAAAEHAFGEPGCRRTAGVAASSRTSRTM